MYKNVMIQNSYYKKYFMLIILHSADKLSSSICMQGSVKLALRYRMSLILSVWIAFIICLKDCGVLQYQINFLKTTI